MSKIWQKKKVKPDFKKVHGVERINGFLYLVGVAQLKLSFEKLNLTINKMPRKMCK